MKPVLFRRIECFMGRTSGSLTVTSDTALAGSLATPLVPQKYGRSICIVRVDIVQKLSAMMDDTRWLARVIRLLLIVLLEADFREAFATGCGVRSRWHGCRHIR